MTVWTFYRRAIALSPGDLRSSTEACGVRKRPLFDGVVANSLSASPMT
jgi:hypothetical protein